jgi:hypothetical protein
MSGYDFGGSALTVDIGVRNGTCTGGAAVTAETTFVPGDWVALSAQPNSDSGYEAVRVTLASSSDALAAQMVMPVGVVLGPPGKTYLPATSATANNGDEFLIRIKGVADAKVTAAGATTAPVALLKVTDAVHAIEATSRDFEGTAAHALVFQNHGIGVMIEDHGGTGVETVKCWVLNNRI